MVDTNIDFTFKQGPDIFSPKDLIELGRPGSGVANPAGDLALVPYSEYSSAEKENKKSIHVIPIDSSATPLQIPLPKGGDAFWLDSRAIGHAVEGAKGTELYAVQLDFESQTGGLNVSPPILLGHFPTKTVTNYRYSPEAGFLVFSDYAWPDGNLSTVKAQDNKWDKRGNTAYVYDTTFVRHWDTWLGKKRPFLFSVSLSKNSDGKWVLGDEYYNPLKGTGHHCPVEPFGGTDDFDVSKTYIIYTTKNPKFPKAWHTKQNIYVVDFKGQKQPRELTSGEQGAVHNPVFNAQGTKAAWLELDEDGYESDRAKIVIYDFEKEVRYTFTQEWDRSPDSLAFSKEGNFIYFTAGDEAKIKIWVLPIPPTPGVSTTRPDLPSKYTKPVSLTHHHAASAIQPLSDGRLLFTRSSYTSPNDIFVIHDLKGLGTITSSSNHIHQLTRFTEKALKGKHLSKGEEFWFKGADNRNVQGWLLMPRGWHENDRKKWPIVLLIHGGPQGAWEDQWSTRWNPNVFAQQGYFVVAINPTGSTSFGQEFTDAIAEDWGGKPFVDMRKGWEHILQHYPQVDRDRAVAAGASWGGYAINWIQGHPEYGFNFKALVCHDGVFDTNYNGFSTDELFFFNHEWGGRPWDKKSRELSLKYSPSNFVEKWSTPQLLIHGSKDYRLPETESIGAFHALQQLGVPSRLVVFPDENHWVLNHGNSLKWHYEVLRWFDNTPERKQPFFHALDMSAALISTFTRPLASSGPPATLISSESMSGSPEATERKRTLRALLVSLNTTPGQSELDYCINTLIIVEKDIGSTFQDAEEEVLRNAVIFKLLVNLYGHALESYLSQAMQAEAEADWWGDVERSRFNIIMYLVQTFPLRISSVASTVLRALRAQQLPVRFSVFSPGSLRRLFPAPKAFQAGAYTTAFFPHLRHQPLSVATSTVLFANFTQEPDAFANTIARTIFHYMQLAMSTITLPMELARQECDYKRKELEKIRDQRAEVLGRLAFLRGALIANINSQPNDLRPVAELLEYTISGNESMSIESQNAVLGTSVLPSIARLSSFLFPSRIVHEEQLMKLGLTRPSKFVQLWPKLFLLPPLCIYALRSAYASRATIAQVLTDAGETVVGFIRGWLIDPLKDVLRTVRAGGEDGVIVQREAVAADFDSLERMALSLAKDELHYGPNQLQEFSQQIRVGDLTPILELYEEDIKHPLKSVLLGRLLRSVFIQVQKAKVDIDQTLTGIDRLLKSQELTFAFVGVAPAFAIVYLVGGSLVTLYSSGRGHGKYGGKAKRSGVWVDMRRIERLLISQPGGQKADKTAESPTTIAPLISGLLLLAVARLRMYAETHLPVGSRAREGFLEDVTDLEDPDLGRREKIFVLDRMWRCWSPILGWDKAVTLN
ncbi:hypothetical protein APHAL10511_002619 [Amanita phalloides]|nr:hypothetical protein APHAL10511_002619 [Amanita phalloides]